MRLSSRRFPDRIIRRREMPGDYKQHGEYEPGPTSDVELRASVQPERLEDTNEVGGGRLSERWTVYVLPAADGTTLAGAFDNASADKVLWQGEIYNVIESQNWPSYTRALIGRNT